MLWLWRKQSGILWEHAVTMQDLTLTVRIKNCGSESRLFSEPQCSFFVHCVGRRTLGRWPFLPIGVGEWGSRNVQGQRSLWPEEKSLSYSVTHLSSCLRLSYPPNLPPSLPPSLSLFPLFLLSLSTCPIYICILHQANQQTGKIKSTLS